MVVEHGHSGRAYHSSCAIGRHDGDRCGHVCRVWNAVRTTHSHACEKRSEDQEDRSDETATLVSRVQALEASNTGSTTSGAQEFQVQGGERLQAERVDW